MKYTEEIFNILSKGGFISSNSVSTQVKRLYDAIEEDLPDYYDYYKGIGFYLEGGAVRLKYICDMKIRVVGYKAYCQGRAIGDPGSYYVVWEDGIIQTSNNLPK